MSLTCITQCLLDKTLLDTIKTTAPEGLICLQKMHLAEVSTMPQQQKIYVTLTSLVPYNWK